MLARVLNRTSGPPAQVWRLLLAILFSFVATSRAVALPAQMAHPTSIQPAQRVMRVVELSLGVLTTALDAQRTIDAYGVPFRDDGDGNGGDHSHANRVPFSTAIGTPFLFGGQFYDAVLELYSLRFRDYDPALGKFLQRDSLGMADGLNIYLYVGANPVNFIDPLGLSRNPPDAFEILRALWDDTGRNLQQFQESLVQFLKGFWGTLDDLFINPHLRFVDTYAISPVNERLIKLGVSRGDRLVIGTVATVVAATIAGRLIGPGTAPAINGGSPTGAFNEGTPGGQGLGSLQGVQIRVTPKGLALVEKHVTTRFDPWGPNQAMLARLRQAMVSGETVSGADASYYMHEASEATMMNRGLMYDVAHPAAIQKYGVSEYSVYHPEVIQQFAGEFQNAFRSFWGMINE